MAQEEKQVYVNIGEKDLIEVKGNPELQRYEIKVPYVYDAYWMLKHRDYAKEFEPELKEGQKKDWGYKHFYVPIDQLSTPKDIEQFNIKIAHARKEYREYCNEFLAFDTSLPGNPSVIEKLKMKMAFEGNGNMDVRINKGVPPIKFLVGEVLAVGKHFVLFEGGERGDIKYLQAVETNRLLSSSELEDREKSIHEKFKVGHEMYVSFGNNGKFSKIEPSEYQKDLNNGLSQAEALDKAIARQEERDKKKLEAQAIEESMRNKPAKQEEVKAKISKSRNKQKSKEQDKSMSM